MSLKSDQLELSFSLVETKPAAAERRVWPRPPLFAYRKFYHNLNKYENPQPKALKTEMDWSIWQQWGIPYDINGLKYCLKEIL